MKYIHTIEVYERYIANQNDMDWWEENMPAKSKFKPTYNYRRTNPRIVDIERLKEIPGNDRECVVRFYGGEEITVLANFDELCVAFNDICNAIIMEDDHIE